MESAVQEAPRPQAQVTRSRTSGASTSGSSAPRDGNTSATAPAAAKDAKKKNMGTGLIRLISLAGPEKSRIMVGCFFLIISSGATVIVPSIFGSVIDSNKDAHKSDSERKDALDKAIIELVVVVAIGSLSAMIRAYCFNYSGERVVAKLRNDLYRSLVRQELAFFDKTRTGELMNRLSSDTATLQDAATVNISMLLRYVLQILGSLVFMFIISWKLTLVMLAVVPFVAMGTAYYGMSIRKFRKEFQEADVQSPSKVQSTQIWWLTVLKLEAEKAARL
ncbi:hypothetical protein CYMTET_52292 [Cymbomonas tetramitiformis]|uniref:ABC transmembrane type-1 domain-containing protein n=1 Tax=Cymbomonas tetramitiformis TaxID=36881 RepID=A0AAE0BJC9_9CHLO|nr:hypothetical protein CYMTET_52292 [Cymbomonas tetramitiformis]